MSDLLRRTAPGLVTYVALLCGFTAILLTGEGHLGWAGVFILLAWVVDALDGLVARRLDAASSFGAQLDSLADVVDFGLAPAFLSYRHLQLSAAAPLGLAAGLGFLNLAAGIFRLARFNLSRTPSAGRSGQTIGLTISTSGALLTIAVMTSRTYAPAGGLIVLATLAALPPLMVSQIRFPEGRRVLRRWRWNLIALVLAGAASLLFSPQAVALSLLTGYVAFGVLRAAFEALPYRSRQR